jgi:prevent-host-death family protein
MTYVLPVTEARKEFLNLVDKIDEDYLRVDLTKNGRIKATLISPDYIDELEETIYTLTHSMPAIRKAQKEFREGKYVTLETFLKGLHAGKTIPTSSKRTKKGTKVA